MRKPKSFTGHISLQRNFGVTTAPIDLEALDIEEYYNGYANRTLWPLFHYRIDLAEYERGFADGYERINARFADTVCPLIEKDDLVRVNDYHLFPLGREIRPRGCANRIRAFLHIPWPPMRLLLSLPRHRELVESMFDYDIVGFQCEDWLQSFLDYAPTRPDAEITADSCGTRCCRRKGIGPHWYRGNLPAAGMTMCGSASFCSKVEPKWMIKLGTASYPAQ